MPVMVEVSPIDGYGSIFAIPTNTLGHQVNWLETNLSEKCHDQGYLACYSHPKIVTAPSTWCLELDNDCASICLTVSSEKLDTEDIQAT
jgi:hypothetical protein